jgi:hypothetical protein
LLSRFLHGANDESGAVAPDHPNADASPDELALTRRFVPLVLDDDLAKGPKVGERLTGPAYEV